MHTGPVFHFELVGTARKRRFFAARFGFGLILLAVVAANYLPYSGWFGPMNTPHPGELTIQELAWFSRGLFYSMMAAQAALVLGLTPALVGDAIASERHRKTLHYLLASDLRGDEIVLGKLAARMINIGVFLLVALPIISLLTLFGGIDPVELFWFTALLATSGIFLAAMAMLVSVHSARPRDAVATAYGLTAAWLFTPSLIFIVVQSLPSRWMSAGYWVQTVFHWVWPPHPFSLLTSAPMVSRGGPGLLRRMALGMMAFQCGYAAIFIALAAWRLRPAFRRLEGKSGRRRLSLGSGWRRRWGRPCGDDPVYWKEAHFGRVRGGLARQLVGRLLPLLLVGLVLWVGYESRGAFTEVIVFGYSGEARYGERSNLNEMVRVLGTMLVACWLLWLAGLAAATMTSEREQDTWISLLSTPLEGREIVRGKMLGSLRASAPFGVALVAIWLIGAAAGAIHPLGLLASLAGLALFVWYVVALGTFVSLRSKSTWRAQATAQSILIVPHMCCIIPTPLFMLAYAPWSYTEVSSFFQYDWDFVNEWRMYALVAAYVFGGVAIYSAAAAAMTFRVFWRFDAVAERPRRPPGHLPPAPPGLAHAGPSPAAKEAKGGQADEPADDLAG